ncbi:MAG: prolipoprotein diacylglyceryl transferase [Bacteroidota bacterium]
MPFLASIYWNVRPEIFSLGVITVRWYGLLFTLGFVIGYIIMQVFFKKEEKDLKYLDALTVYMLIGTVVGARLGHCLFYSPGYYLSHPIEILKVWEGGLASHGAGIGILLALWLFSRKYKEFSMLWILDRIAVVVALAGSFIRLGNFMNSEIIGKPSNLPWAVVFERVDLIPRHPAQLYESFAYLSIFILLITIYFVQKAKFPDGYIFGLFLTLVFGIRFLLEFLKESQVSFESTLPIDMGQILSIPFIAAGIFLFYRASKKKKKTNGW